MAVQSLISVVRKGCGGALFACAVGLAVIAGCATQDTSYGRAPEPAENQQPGPFLGAIHGVLSPLTLVASLSGKCSVYAVPNDGLGYDVGFALGIAFLPFVVGVFTGRGEAKDLFR